MRLQANAKVRKNAAEAAGITSLASRRLRNAILFWGYGASGAAALIYEVVWSRALANTIGGNVYAFSILLASFLAGLAIGGHIGGVKLIHQQDHVRVFGLIQLGIGFFGVTSYFAITNLQTVYGYIFYALRSNYAFFTIAQMAVVFVVMLVPTTLMGAGLPVVIEAWSLRDRQVGRNAGNIYSVNTWGAVAGSLAAGFVLVPMLGLRWANLTAAAINFILAILAFLISDSRFLASAAATMLVLLAPLGVIYRDHGLRFSYANADHFESYEDFQAKAGLLTKLFDQESSYGRVQVFETPMTDSRGKTRLLINGGLFEGSNGDDAMGMRVLAYLPLAIHERPKSLLNIGLGTGGTLSAAARDDRLRDIDVVEINPAIYDAVNDYFFPQLLGDRRVREITDDARHYVTNTDKRYDVIISQPSHPTRKTAAHLFTREFYETINKKLKKDGVYVQWLPKYLLSDQDMLIAAKTLGTVFPNTYAWDFETMDTLLVASKSPRQLDISKIDARIRAFENDAAGWVFIGGPGKMAALVADKNIPINTDDLPYIEFAAARNKVMGIKGLTTD